MQEDTKKMLENILDSKEIAELQMFGERPVMVEALRKVLLQTIFYQGVMEKGKPFNPSMNYMLNLVGSQMANDGLINAQAIGEDVKAKWEATRLIQTAFRQIESLQKVAEVKLEEKNRAR